MNTGGYRFNSPTPDFNTNYIARIDYNLSEKMKVFGRFTINRENSIESLPVLPTDPVTHPRIDRSYSYVVSHVWQIGSNKVNQFYYGDTISKFDFPNAYNPTGIDAYSFSGLSSPYSAPTARNGEFRSRRSVTTSTGRSSPTPSPLVERSSSSRRTAT